MPPCGLYRTTREIAGIPADRLVYFHNHGDPGPGLYLPEAWEGNCARFSQQGHTLPKHEDAAGLERVPDEGFYRVRAPFFCCDKRCQEFSVEMLVQLGYDGEATPIVFIPEIVNGVLALPDEGVAIDRGTLSNLVKLRVSVARGDVDEERRMLH